jgi:sulfate adenylyltransferase subunit 1 (EFTu-like GTPase family)
MLKMLGSVASVSKHLTIEGQKHCAGEAQTIVLQLLQTLASLRGDWWRLQTKLNQYLHQKTTTTVIRVIPSLMKTGQVVKILKWKTHIDSMVIA